jgi:ubiquinone/menaquinone biosynthesis C-methylase UbiE
VSTFRDFELGRWEDPGVCSAYLDRVGPVVVQVMGHMLSAVAVGPRDRLLDVATGSGTVASAAAARGADAVGVDFSAEQLRRARLYHPDLTFRQGEAEALPFDPETFDVVVCNFGAPHFPDPEGFFADSLRVLRPGGRFAFTVWAPPEQTKAFGAVLAAVAEHGVLDVGLPAGPNFFLHADADTARASLVATGFDAVEVSTVAQTWELAGEDDVFEAILTGTARTSALLQLQEAHALTRIRLAVREAMLEYRGDDDTYRIPMPAVLVTGVKPA